MVGGYDIAVRERGIKYSLPARLQNKLLSANKNLISEKISRPWDTILLPSVSAGQPDLLDVTITSPLQPSLNSDAPRRYGFALTNAEMKNEIYTQKCARMGIQFLPLVFEPFGGLTTRSFCNANQILPQPPIGLDYVLLNCPKKPTVRETILLRGGGRAEERWGGETQIR